MAICYCHHMGITAARHRCIHSAGVRTGIGDHEEKYTGKENEAESGDEQFEIADNRSLQEIYDAIKDQGLQPVLNEYIYV